MHRYVTGNLDNMLGLVPLLELGPSCLQTLTYIQLLTRYSP